MGLLISASWGNCSYCENNTFLAGRFQCFRVNFGHYGPKLVKHVTSVCGAFYSNNLDSQVNLKRNIEQTVAGIDQVTF
jgi:hypothetical protein